MGESSIPGNGTPMWHQLKQIVLPALLGLTLLVFIGLASSAIVLYQNASQVHPWLGFGVLALIALVFVFLFVLPIVKVASLPKGLKRPKEEEGEAWDAYLEDFGKRLLSNKKLEADYPGFAALSVAHRQNQLATSGEVEKALSWLDLQAKSMIAKQAAQVFASTAVSQSGRLDTFIVFGAQLRLIKDLAVLYYERPTFREVLKLYGNVGATAFVAGEIEDSEVLAVLGAPITAGITGLIPVGGTDPLVSLLVNSLLDGSANAFMTLRIGILTKRNLGLKVESNRKVLARSASLEAASLLADVVGHGSRRVADITRRAVTKGAVQAPLKVAGTAVRGTERVAGAAVRGTGRVAGAASRGTEKVAGAAARGTEKVAGVAVKGTGKAAEGVVDIGAQFWDSVAGLFRSQKTKEVDP